MFNLFYVKNDVLQENIGETYRQIGFLKQFSGIALNIH